MNQPRDPNELRRAIAEKLLSREHQRLGDRLIAAAIYGSTAHRAAREWSDLELIYVVADEEVYNEHHEFHAGVMIESTFVPQTRLLRAAQRISWAWGVEADQYRYHDVLYDPHEFFSRLHQAATHLDPKGFSQALAESWWRAYELLGKARNALAVGDTASAVYVGWEIARSAALRIALYEQRPYESMRTLWHDVQTRGYGMEGLLRLLIAGDTTTLLDALHAVCTATAWEAPEDISTQAH